MDCLDYKVIKICDHILELKEKVLTSYIIRNATRFQKVILRIFGYRFLIVMYSIEIVKFRSIHGYMNVCLWMNGKLIVMYYE